MSAPSSQLTEFFFAQVVLRHRDVCFADVTDAFKKFVEVVLAKVLAGLETFVVEQKAFDQELV